MDASLLKIAEGALQAGGAGLLVVLAAKWFVGDYFAKAKDLRELEKKQVSDAIAGLQKIFAELKGEVIVLKERIWQHEKTMIEGLGRINANNEKMSALMAAFEGFVKTTEQRFRRVEQATSEVIKIGKDIALIRSKKPGSGGGQ